MFTIYYILLFIYYRMYNSCIFHYIANQFTENPVMNINNSVSIFDVSFQSYQNHTFTQLKNVIVMQVDFSR